MILGLGLCGDNYGGGPPGEDSTCFKIDESEATDRTELTLPGSQMTLFRAVLALEKPVVVFLMNAGALDISEIKASGVPIIAAGYGGEFGGQATADVLDGTVNPSGATVQTWYPQKFATLSSFRDMGMRPTASNPGRTYKFLDESRVAPVFPFGFGLSYTTFTMAFVQMPTTPVAPGHTTEWIVKLSNTGDVAGGMAVICYAASTAQSIVKGIVPNRAVFDFSAADTLKPGASQLLAFTLTPRGRALVDTNGNIVTPPGTYVVQCEAGGVAKTAAVTLIVE